MLEPRLDRGRTVHENDVDGQHLGGEVAVREPPPAEGPAALREDAHRHLADERLETDRRLDGPREGTGGLLRDRDPEVLMEDPAELDAGLEEERLAARKAEGPTRSCRGHWAFVASVGIRETVNGPRR